MEVLVVLLLISHIAAIVVFINYTKAYKQNNFNYLDTELKKLDALFFNSVTQIENDLQELKSYLENSYQKLGNDQVKYNLEQKAKISDITTFIKKDYTSLTNHLKINNNYLSELLEKTKDNLIKNEELKPLLLESSGNLELVYDKIKIFIINYEKNINDIKREIESALRGVEDIANSKIKEVALTSEKTMEKTVSANKETIDNITEETNNCLKNILKDNQINLMTEKFDTLDKELRINMVSIQNLIVDLENKMLAKMDDEEEIKATKKKGFFGRLNN